MPHDPLSLYRGCCQCLLAKHASGKEHPQGVTESYYIDELRSRIKSEPTCLNSLQNFLMFLEKSKK